MTAAPHSANPMDNIHVRPLRFDFAHIQARDPVWSRTHPLFSIYINALGVHIPYFERYLMMAFRSVRQDIQDPQLKKDVTSIIGQEAHHARNFVDFNEFLAQRYPEVKGLDERAKQYFESSLKNDDIKAQIGYIAGYETFTFLGGMIILDGYDKWMKDADPVIRSMWVWHQVEEVEHGAVAFDVYKYFYKKHEWYRKWMVVKSLLHIASETWLAYKHMVKKEGYFKSPFKALKAIGFFANISAQLAIKALPVFSSSYHPRQMSKKENNPIALAWRDHYQEGNPVLEMSNAQIDQMSEVDHLLGARKQ
jgi:predicted metal-dependent hydrolase